MVEYFKKSQRVVQVCILFALWVGIEIFAKADTVPLPEYPRPDFQRDSWLNLNGWWDFEFDKEDAGLTAKWYDQHEWSRRILVPYVHQCQRSGIGDDQHYRQVWYHRTFTVPASFAGKRIRLNVGAADFRATVWVNGKEVGTYEGGYTPFGFDITDCLLADSGAANDVTIRVYDNELDREQPRGKQNASGRRTRYSYTHVTGIWQTVWLEAVNTNTIDHYRVVTDINPAVANFTVFSDSTPNGSTITIELTDPRGKMKPRAASASVAKGKALLKLDCPSAKLWSPDEPSLYDIKLTLKIDGHTVDEVRSYIGFRTVEAKDGKFYLNGEPVWHNGALDQGYWPDTLYTHPSDEAAIEDIMYTKRIGLNHIRKHQMVADPRFLYHCDRLGLLVWGEMANAASGSLTPRAIEIADREWQRAIQRDYNHPSIVTWVYSNENWMHGGPIEKRIEHYRQAYKNMKQWDPTRPIIDTSGYHHVESDIMDTHYYEPQKRASTLYQWAEGKLENPENIVFLTDIPYKGQPIIISEWLAEGFADFRKEQSRSWLIAYIERLGQFASNPLCEGHCYIQLYDVERELNGYLQYDRQPKMTPEQETILREAHLQAQKRDLQFDWEGFIQKYFPEKMMLRNPEAMDKKNITTLVSDSEKKGHQWRYTFDTPDQQWKEQDFDDSGWAQGLAPFGKENTPGIKPNTEWQTADIWMRCYFELENIDNQLLMLKVFHDEDSEIYVNGVLASRLNGWVNAYQGFPANPEAAMSLQKGKNCIAVHCHQTKGGQGIDVGLMAIQE